MKPEDLRKKVKGKKPKFMRQDVPKRKRLAKKWKSPKGMHSKVKRKVRGKRKPVEVGYRGPKGARTMHPSGLKPIVIDNINQVKCVVEGYGAVLSSKLGMRKREAIINECIKQGKRILNLKEPKSKLEKIQNELKERKETRMELLKKRDELTKKAKKKEPKKKEAKSPKKEETPAEVEKKKEKKAPKTIQEKKISLKEKH